jgi:hypothetical protein
MDSGTVGQADAAGSAEPKTFVPATERATGRTNDQSNREVGMLTRNALCLSVLLAAVAPAAGEECTKLLTPDITVDFTKRNTRAYLDTAMCTMTSDEFRKKYGVATSGQYFGIGGSANFDSADYEAKKSATCNDLTSEKIDQSLYYFSSRIIPQAARDDYLKCVEHKPLACLF